MTIAEALQNFDQERESGEFDKVEEELLDKVRIMTMHSSKGLEAKLVFIPAMEDDLMLGHVVNMEERRRLFYVSITRAKPRPLLVGKTLPDVYQSLVSHTLRQYHIPTNA